MSVGLELVTGISLRNTFTYGSVGAVDVSILSREEYTDEKRQNNNTITAEEQIMKMRNNFKDMIKNRGFWTYDKEACVHSFTDLDVSRRLNMSREDKSTTKKLSTISVISMLVLI